MALRSSDCSIPSFATCKCTETLRSQVCLAFGLDRDAVQCVSAPSQDDLILPFTAHLDQLLSGATRFRIITSGSALRAQPNAGTASSSTTSASPNQHLHEVMQKARLTQPYENGQLNLPAGTDILVYDSNNDNTWLAAVVSGSTDRFWVQRTSVIFTSPPILPAVISSTSVSAATADATDGFDPYQNNEYFGSYAMMAVHHQVSSRLHLFVHSTHGLPKISDAQ